jgi:chromosome partitioning protein
LGAGRERPFGHYSKQLRSDCDRHGSESIGDQHSCDLRLGPDRSAILGLRKHLQDLQELKSEFHLEFTPQVLFTRYDGREAASREILSQCVTEFEDLLMKSYIRTSTEIKNSIGSAKTIFSTKSNAKEDYDLVTKELLGLSDAIHF